MINVSTRDETLNNIILNCDIGLLIKFLELQTKNLKFMWENVHRKKWCKNPIKLYKIVPPVVLIKLIKNFYHFGDIKSVSNVFLIGTNFILLKI